MSNIFLSMSNLRAVRNENLQQRAYFLRHICSYGERIFLKFGVVNFAEISKDTPHLVKSRR